MRSTFGSDGPRTSVIVSAYNQPGELRLVLAALAAQTDRRFEVWIADDGSAPPARETLDALRGELPYPVDSVWQPDRGFRKMCAQNRAALAATGELLLFCDGDCLPYRDWVETYRRAARPGEFLVGGYIFLDEARTRALTPESVRRGAHEQPLDRETWWRLHRAHWQNRLYAGWRRNRPRIRGGNFGVARDLFERVDGFDEAFAGYGKEDSELRNRMRRAGARGISLWSRARLCHLSTGVFPGVPRPPTPRDLYEASFRRVRARVGLSSHAPGAERDEPVASAPCP